MENVVAVELFRRAAEDPKLEIFYWKDVNGKEVDFVIKKGPKVIELVQVCYNVDDYIVKSRETTALIKASSDLSCNNLKVLTWDNEDTEMHEGKKVEFIPLWSWLLQI
jgi:predicted AAA+ superfamily ATPase